MKRCSSLVIWSLLALLLVFIPSLAHAEAGPGGLTVQNGQKVVFLGDSITGLGWSVPGGYVRLVALGLETAGVKIEPFGGGMSGNTSREMLARLDRDVLSKKPDWMTLSCGVNDVWGRAIDLDTFEKNITAIVDRTQAAGIKVMILTATPIYEASDNEFNKKLPAYNDFLRHLAGERKLPLADVNAAWMTILKAQPPGAGTRVLTVDGVHPNPDGHQAMAREVLKAFGASPDQIARADEAWLNLPGGATISGDIRFIADDQITLRQYNALKKVAADQKTTVFDLGNTLFLEAIRDTLQANEPVSFAKFNQMRVEAKKSFVQKIEALIPR